MSGTVALSSPAPAGGTAVTLTSSSLPVAGLAAPLLGPFSVVSLLRVTVPQGQSTLTFEVRTAPVAALSQVTIGAATATESSAAILAVTAPSAASVQIVPASTLGGTKVTGTAVLNGVAPTGGYVVALRSSGPAATVPASVTVPAANDRVAFTISTLPVSTRTQVAIIASSTATPTQATGNLSVLAPAVQFVQIESSPPGVTFSALGGRSASVTVVLNGPAAIGGQPVALRSSSSAAPVPGSLTIPAASDRAKFSVTTQAVSAITAVTIGATAGLASAPNTSIGDGSSNTIQIGEATANLALFPIPRLLSILAAPSPVTGGDSLSVTFKLALTHAGPATLPAPCTAQIVGDRPDVVQLPATLTVPCALGVVGGNGLPPIVAKGTTSAPSADATVTITATLEGQSVSTTLLVRKPQLAIASFTLRPTTSRGGNNVIGSILLGPAITTPTVVTLTSDRPDLVQPPASITVAPSPVAQPVTISTLAVTAPVTVTITAAVGAQRVTSTVTLTP